MCIYATLYTRHAIRLHGADHEERWLWVQYIGQLTLKCIIDCNRHQIGDNTSDGVNRMPAKLSNGQLPNQLSGVVNGTKVVDTYVQAILAQPDIEISALENLPAHQALARKHAKFWQTQVKPDIQQSITDTIEFSNAFLGKYDTLNKLIQKLKNGDGNAKTEFISEIDSLKNNLSSVVVSHSQKVTAKLSQFGSLLNQDMRNFLKDSEEAQTKIIGETGELKAMQDHLDAINKAIDRDIGLIAGGFFCIWLAVGGGIDLHKQEEAKGDVKKEMAIKNQELIALNAAKHHIDGFVVTINPVSQAAASLEQSWASLTSDFGEVFGELKDLSDTSAVDFLEPILETAKKDWNYALEQAQQLKL